jgi:hypothetical protein
MKSLEWFKARVNKRVFRDKSDCTCLTCEDVAKNGLVILSEEHADYLYWNQNEFANDGLLLNYRDKLEKNV